MTDQEKQESRLPFQCQHCQRRFKRLEHVQRHERTHTKEAPYKCPCGKSFPRGDLLRRHEKTAHNIDQPRRKRAHSTSAISGQSAVLRDAVSPIESKKACTRCNYNSSNDTGTGFDIPPSLQHGAPAHTDRGQPILDASPRFQPTTSYERNGSRSNLQGTFEHPGTQNADQVSVANPPDQTFAGFDYPSLDPFDLFGEGDNIFENVDFSSLFLPQGFALDQDFQLESISDSNERSQANGTRQSQQSRDLQPNDSSAEQNSISRFGSPLPSVRPSKRDEGKAVNRSEALTKSTPRWKVSTPEYLDVKLKVSMRASILPPDFVLPSKHTLSRYLEGCIKGLLEHMPYVHIPTWSVTASAPDLLLAMCSIGACFRFEKGSAVKLFYAAKAIIMNQLRAIKGEKLVDMLSQPPSLHTGSNDTSPPSSRDMHNTYSSNNRTDGDISLHNKERLQTMQAIISLMVLGSWGAREIVGEAIAFQSLLAELVRQDGLGPESEYSTDLESYEESDSGWLRWIHAESLRRTKLMAYTFINLQSVAYNVSPCMLTSEIRFNTPASMSEWRANDSGSWAITRRASKIATTPFSEAFRSLFQGGESGTNTPVQPSCAIGNYALIFGILQTIFFLREGSATIPNRQDTRNLRPDDIESLSQALQNWQSRWENSPESNVDPQSSTGPVAFNSTALLRLAWIRLYSDLGPCRNLASRNPSLIVEAFKSCPPLHRQPSLTPALLHAAHALSVPVRLGISYVAKTQTLSWSVQHSMANLEGCIFLSKWFEAVASTLRVTPLTSQEMGIIHLIRSIVLESGFFREDAFAPAVDEQGWQRLIQHIGTAVASLWAEVFSGTHVFEMVSTIGSSLSIYAKLLEDAHTPINGYA